MKKYPVCLVLTGYCSIRAFKASKPSVGSMWVWLSDVPANTDGYHRSLSPLIPASMSLGMPKGPELSGPTCQDRPVVSLTFTLPGTEN